MIFRELQPQDAGPLSEFFTRNNVDEVTQHFHPFPLNEECADKISTSQGKDRYYVAIVEGAIVGFAMLRGWDEGFEIPSYGLLIDRTHQARGIGRQLTLFVLDEAKEVSEAVRLSVHKSNSRALNLYRGMGFEFVERSDSGSEEIYIMRKEFRDAENSN